MAIAEPYWSVAIDQGYTLALPQSSQIEFTDAFDWDDIEKGAAELKAHIDGILSGGAIISEGAIDPNNIVIGSFSAGAGPALYAVLKGMVKVRALIFVAPWLPEIDRWTAMLDQLKTKEIPCHIQCGGQDEDCLESSQAFVKQLKKRQIPYTFQLIDGLDHDFPETFAEDLEKFLRP
jgi:predicted esterase